MERKLSVSVHRHELHMILCQSLLMSVLSLQIYHIPGTRYYDIRNIELAVRPVPDQESDNAASQRGADVLLLEQAWYVVKTSMQGFSVPIPRKDSRCERRETRS
jgi:hypothetical protein